MSNITTNFNGKHQTVVSNIVYLPFGPINALTYGNGMTHSRTYDTDYRLTGRIDSGVLNYAYTRDATGNIIEHTNVTEIGFCDGQFCGSAVTLDINRYQYDTVHRLTQSDMNSDIEAFSYDALGNRLSRTHNGASRQYFYGLEDHRLRQIANGTVHSFTHDALGNTLSTHSHTFSYDDNNRIKTVDDTASTLLATYTYNAQNLRTKKTAGAITTYYHYNHEGQLISESDNSGNITREYMYLNGMPIAMSDANGRYYLHSDHLGSPKLMTDSQQDIVWQATHTAFGEATTDEDPDGDGVNVRLNIRFPGQYYDEETSLHYNWNRYYDPSIGRYITSDPIGLAGGINTYGYVSGNPLSHIDPTGLISLNIPGTSGETAVHGNPGPDATDFRPEHGPAHVHLGSNDGPRVRTDTFEPLSDADAQRLSRKQKKFCKNLSDQQKDLIRLRQGQVFRYGRILTVLLATPPLALDSLTAACKQDPFFCIENTPGVLDSFEVNHCGGECQ